MSLLSEKVEALERELERMEQRYDSAAEDRDDFERKWLRACDKIEQLEEAGANPQPFRPDVKRIDAGDYTRALSSCVCDVCGFQFWEHATVPGFMWFHRICDGRLVRL